MELPACGATHLVSLVEACPAFQRVWTSKMVSISGPDVQRQTTGGGANAPKVISLVGTACVCLAAVLAFFFKIIVDAVFYLWVVGLALQFIAGFWAIKIRLSR